MICWYFGSHRVVVGLTAANVLHSGFTHARARSHVAYIRPTEQLREDFLHPVSSLGH